MNKQDNLVKNSDFSPEERKRRASKAGKAGVKARRVKKQMKQFAIEMLEAALSPEMAKKLAPFGVKEGEASYNAAIVGKQIAKAMAGDTNAFKALQDLTGQNSVQKTETTLNGAGLTFNLATMSREDVEKAQAERDRANGEHLDEI